MSNTDTITLDRPAAVGMEEAARLLGVSTSTLRYWRWQTNSGNPSGPPSYRIGRKVLYDVPALQKWLDDVRAGAIGATGEVKQ
jgi:hypothetical protein